MLEKNNRIWMQFVRMPQTMHSLCSSQLRMLRTLPVQSVMQAFYINKHSVLVTIHIASMLSFLPFVSIVFSQKGQALAK